MTANNNLTTNFNVDPYYDDYDENKNFHRILYRPGFAVQARELTQQQSILQNQIHRFGNHVFRDGSEVTGATEVIDRTGVFRLKSTYAGSAVDVTTLEGKFARTRVSEELYKVKKAVPAADGDFDLIFVQYLQNANTTAHELRAANNEVVDFSSSYINGNNIFTSNTGAAQILATSDTNVAKPPIGAGFLYSVSESVRYHKGLFVRTPQQTIVVAANIVHSMSVGYTSTETLTTSDTDTTLTDPARGSYNYAAPGADRLKVDLTLTAKSISSVDSPPLTSNNYFEITRVEDGLQVRKRPAPDYDILGDVLANRTFEESGNYSVEGLSLTVTNTSVQTSNLIVKVSPGTAYVKGYRIRIPSVTDVPLPKARSTGSVTEQSITGYYGNYLVANTFTTGLVNMNDRVELHSELTPSASTKIGEAHIKNVEYLSGSGDDRKYKVFLYDIRVTASDKNFNNIKSIIKGTHSSFTSFIQVNSSSITTFNKTGDAVSGSADVRFTSVGGIKVGQQVIAPGLTANTKVDSIAFDTVTLSNASTVSNTNQVYTFRSVTTTDSDVTSSVFVLPHSYVANTTNIDYKFKRKFASVSFVSGAATIQTNGGSERFSSGTGDLAHENYIVVVKSGGTGSTPDGSNIDMTAGSRSVTVPVAAPGNPGSATLDVDDASFNGICDIIAAIDVTGDTRRVKTKTQTTKKFANGYPSSASSLSLGYADVIKINAIYEGNSSLVTSNTSQLVVVNGSNTTMQDVTSKFDFNRNQQDSFYDHSTLTLKPGFTANTNQILVDFTYYSHSGGLGYFSDRSYPSYVNIPSYVTRKGNSIDLRDALDFRPTRSANTNSNIYSPVKTFDNHQIVDSQTFNIEADYDYFKRVTHKIALDHRGRLTVASGTPDLNNPPVPVTSSDQMLLATIFVSPYTYNEKDVLIRLQDNGRYTMKDIGVLDKRIENLEYYTSLNLLESQVQSTQFLDDNGDARFKSGFVVDPFKGHSIGNVYDSEYKASIDPIRQFMRPKFSSDHTPMVATAGGNLSINNKIVTLPFTETNFLSQVTASDTINVNPFQVVTFTGIVTLDPSSDSWVDTNNVSVVVNNNGDLDHLNSLSAQVGTTYGQWQQVGNEVIVGNAPEKAGHAAFEYVKTQGPGGAAGGKTIGGTNIQSTFTASVTQTSIQTYTDTSVSTDLSSSVYYPYMRTRKVSFTITGARPNTELYLYFGGINVSSWMAPSTFSSTRAEQVLYAKTNQKQVVTNEFGEASGYFWVPNSRQVLSKSAFDANPNANVSASNRDTSEQLFEAGVVDVMFVNNFLNPQFSTSYCVTTFSSKGRQDTYTTTTTMTKRYQLVSTNAGTITKTENRVGFFLDSTKSAAEIAAENNFSPEALAFMTSTLEQQYALHAGRRPELHGALYWTEAFEVALASGLSASAAAAATAANIKIAAVENEEDPNRCNPGTGQDPLAQTFFIPAEFYPNGIFVSSVDLFIAQKDPNNLPLRVELRPTVNGFPSSEEVIPLSQVSLKPSEINASADSTVATNVSFQAPIHLLPGEYSVVLLTDSLEYITHISTIGEQRLDGTGIVTEQPTLGSLFKSQNARTWTPQQESDLCFRLKHAQFTADTNMSLTLTANNTGRAAYSANTLYANTVGQYDLAYVDMPRYDSLRDISAIYEIKTKNLGGSAQPFERILPNQDLVFTESKEITTDSDLQLKVTFKTSDVNVSPYFDLGSTGTTLIKNIINPPPTGVFVPETEPTNGYADAKYITRLVTLGEGLDAKGLRVFVDQNMPGGATVEVYYRVINRDDDSNFEQRPYVLMSRRQESITVNQDISRYNEYEYFADNITYTQGGAFYSDFNAFSIKIVMYSTSTAAAPSFRNFRAIALL